MTTPLKGLAMLKLNGSVPLPMNFTASAIFQDQPGPAIEAVYAASTAEAFTSLGRNLSGNALTVNIPLVVPNTMFEGRIRRLDVRLSKHFEFRTASPSAQSRRLQRAEFERDPEHQHHLRRQLVDADADSGSAHHPVQRPVDVLSTLAGQGARCSARLSSPGSILEPPQP